MYDNNHYRGLLTLQAHSTADVFAQLPVGQRRGGQLDEIDAQQVKAQQFFDGRINPLDDNSPSVTAAQKAAAYYGAMYADYAVSTAGAVPLNPEPGFFPLNVDVRRNKRLVAQFHDRSSLNSTDQVSAAQAFGNLSQTNRPQDVAYVLTMYLEIEELVTPNSK